VTTIVGVPTRRRSSTQIGNNEDEDDENDPLNSGAHFAIFVVKTAPVSRVLLKLLSIFFEANESRRLRKFELSLKNSRQKATDGKVHSFLSVVSEEVSSSLSLEEFYNDGLNSDDRILGKNYTQIEWRRYKSTLEAGGED
jgi:hypothetical protein